MEPMATSNTKCLKGLFSMKITKEMVDEFNQSLKIMNCSFRLALRAGINGNNNCDIVIANDMFIHSCILNMTDKFYETLESFFAKYGIELSYNNTGSTFWSKNGFDKI